MAGRLPQRVLADVDRHVAGAAAAAVHRVDEELRLHGVARAELEDLLGPHAAHDLVRMELQDPRLGAGEVVLGEAGDVFEEPAAA